VRCYGDFFFTGVASGLSLSLRLTGVASGLSFLSSLEVPDCDLIGCCKRMRAAPRPALPLSLIITVARSASRACVPAVGARLHQPGRTLTNLGHRDRR
jgi:hypothetical protein